MRGGEAGREEAGGMSHEGGLGQDIDQGKGQTLPGQRKRVRTDIGPPAAAAAAAAAAGEHDNARQLGRGKPSVGDKMGEDAYKQEDTAIGGATQRTNAINSHVVTGTVPRNPNMQGGQRKALCSGPEMGYGVAHCIHQHSYATIRPVLSQGYNIRYPAASGAAATG
jgi:hypothetical protein